MPKSGLGQLITLAVEVDADQHYSSYIWVDTRVDDTVRKIAARRGHPEQARDIADLNGVRSATQVLHHRPRRSRDRMRIRVPGTLRQKDVIDILADTAPHITGGYAKIEVEGRPGRVGISHFVGYDPSGIDLPIWFENFTGRQAIIYGGAREGAAIEADITTLERMAGRGNFAGAANGPPPVIRISTTDGRGNIVPLIPANYQWSPQNPSAPLWWITGIDWDATPDRNTSGNRIRQKATVSLGQYTPISFETRSVTQRAKSKKKR